ncbi:Uu.00g123100.m01.CDS01 [Anthostomella pinea]|uniref:Uu.00g123100.m01.CDS01 n=1 Tax=Anthostomella pinea TaxID=933095 RepID=A0AAI8VI05_9PEZI|nr:Uu.00g123100.m01.CDS01 [Anthostomella pinea]
MSSPYAHSSSGAASRSTERFPVQQGHALGHARSLSGSNNDGFRALDLAITVHEEDVAGIEGIRAPFLNEPHMQDRQQGLGLGFLPRRLRTLSIRKILFVLLLASVIFGATRVVSKDHAKRVVRQAFMVDVYPPPVAQLPGSPDKAAKPNPIQWLRANTIFDVDQMPEQYRKELLASRPRAALIALVHNSEINHMVYSIAQLEARFNGRLTHQYDWVFFSDEEFTDQFKQAVADVTSSQCYFEVITKEHWSDTSRFDEGRSLGVSEAWLHGSHHMRRWNAGLFAMEKSLANYDYFWRVEPGVDFRSNINYDVFRFMQDNNMAYGFNMAILDDARSFPSLWDSTKSFVETHKNLIHDDADYDWFLQDPRQVADASQNRTPADEDDEDAYDSMEYNSCQSYSELEIGDLSFFRGEEHRSYLKYLDNTGGFHDENFGNAPIHTMSVSMFLPKSRIWYFKDIGYAHGVCTRCTQHELRLTIDGEPVPVSLARSIVINQSLGETHRYWEVVALGMKRQSGIPGLSSGCTVSAIYSDNGKVVPFKSKERKASHPCTCLSPAGEGFEKDSGWNREEVIAAGRAGFEGYIHDGFTP